MFSFILLLYAYFCINDGPFSRDKFQKNGTAESNTHVFKALGSYCQQPSNTCQHSVQLIQKKNTTCDKPGAVPGAGDVTINRPDIGPDL